MSPKISKRPSNILNVRSTFPKSGIEEKFDADPTSPKPGPTVLIVAADAVNAVVISTPIAESASPTRNRIRI